MKSASAKNKGRLLQQKVRDAILDVFPELTEDDVRSTSMGVSGTDIQLSAIGKRLFPYDVECKNYAKFAVYNHYNQRSTELETLLVIKQNRSKPLAIVDLDHFMSLVRRAHEDSISGHRNKS